MPRFVHMSPEGPIYTDERGNGAYARRAAGEASGALAGQFPEPGLGLVPLAGTSPMWDDFVAADGEIATGRYGNLLWPRTTVGAPGPGGATANSAPSDWTEDGVLTVTTGSGSANVGYIFGFTQTASVYRVPPPGSTWACKVRVTTGTSDYELWSGFASSANRVANADAVDFVGVRSIGGNLFGVVKNGAASETTVDLGIDCESSTWRIVGFTVGGDTTTPSVQFFIANEHDSIRDIFDVTNVGDPITATVPNTTLCPIALGFVTTNTSDKVAEIDFWVRGGRTAR